MNSTRRGKGSVSSAAVPALILVCALGISGCDSGDAIVEDQRVRDGSPGPLIVGVAEGGGSVDAPGGEYADYAATFGGFTLCAKGGKRVIIKGVQFPLGSPVEVRAYLRTVTPEAVASSEPTLRRRFAPLGFGLGSAPKFHEKYAGEAVPGDYRKLDSDLSVDVSCQAKDHAVIAVNRNEVPKSSFVELMIVLPSTTEGVDVDGFTINYEAGGRDYAHRVNWWMQVCDQAGARSYC